MRIVTEKKTVEELEFARKAAECFANEPESSTFTVGEIEPDCLLAIRWGLTNRAVLIVRVGDDVPVVYNDIIVENDGKDSRDA